MTGDFLGAGTSDKVIIHYKLHDIGRLMQRALPQICSPKDLAGRGDAAAYSGRILVRMASS